MSTIERVLRNTPATLSVTFYVDETPTDPDSNAVTVSAVKADGTQHTAPTSATRAGVGVYTFPLPAQATLNELTFSWAGQMGGLDVTLTSYVEIVGGFYFSIPELRSYDDSLKKQVGGVYKYTYADLVYWRMFVENEFEKQCRRAFVPRFYRERFKVTEWTNYFFVKWPEVRDVTKLTVDGVDKISWVASEELRSDPDDPWMLKLMTEYLSADSEVVIEYEYGWDAPPMGIVETAKQRARGLIVSGTTRVEERATRVDIPQFGTMSMARPGIGRYQIGIPEIDTMLDRWTLDSTGGVY